MFYAPTTVASMVAPSPEDDGSPYELYSCLHKDAFGCRPGVSQMARYNAMSPIERIVEHKRMAEWSAEDDRITGLAQEVARFRFSRGMEYHQRRSGVSEKGALRYMIEAHDRYFFKDGYQDWEFACFHLDLPNSDAPKLKEIWEG